MRNHIHATIAGAAFLAIAITEAAYSQTQPSLPQLIYMRREGLDVQRNELDRLINMFGVICDHAYSKKPCRIESEVIALLKRMGPNRAVIAHELSASGAECVEDGNELQCALSRRVRVSAMVFGSPTPVSVTDEFLKLLMRVSGEDGFLQFDARFDRRSELRSRSN